MGRSVEEYLATLHEWWDAVLRTATCPRCHCAYRQHQTRDRAAWEDGDHAQRILVLRIRCPVCGATQTVLPDFLTPYRRYLTPVREGVITGADAAPACDARTARRWLTSFRARIAEGIQILTSALQQHLPPGRQETAFLTLGAASARALRQVRAILHRHGHAPPASGLLGWANQTLSAVAATTLL